jgi:hypothetical protein
VKGVGVADRRRGPGGARGGRCSGVPGVRSPRIDSLWFCRGGRRSGGLELGRRRGISVRSNSPAVDFGSKSGEGVTWTGVGELEKAPWVHGGAPARVCRVGEAAGWRERGGAEPPRGGAREAAARVWGDSGGGGWEERWRLRSLL